MELIGSIHKGGGQDGDFGWMREQPRYTRALFVFNDNEEEFLEHHRGHTGGGHCHRGGGNAAIRPWQDEDPPRATGIPTGSNGKGYPALTAPVRETIDTALGDLRTLLATGRYDCVVYSAAADGSGRLGISIFKPGDDVLDHILAGLRAAADEAGTPA